MSSDGKIEVGVGSAKIVASGKGLASVGKTFSDLLSPFSEGFGLIGDHIRLYRERSVQKVLEKASDIALERDEPVRPVHPKNLVPLIENASLESQESNELLDLWARLLLSGDVNFDAELAVFSDTLKRIGKIEADILKSIVLDDEKYPDSSFEDLDLHYDELHFQDSMRLLNTIENKDEFKRISKEIFDKSDNITYGQIMYIGEIGAQSRPMRTYFHEIYLEHDVSIRILEKEGLVRIINQKISDSRGTFSIVYFRATSLGVSLISRCYPEGPSTEKN